MARSSDEVGRPFPRWLSSSQAAELIGCDPRTLRRMVAEGRLPAARLGPRRLLRFDPRDLEALRRPGAR